ncbi:MAG: OmpH family outer membrane protein [Erythrobacter sp.]|nr:OmpH family outer membrane protein [Erythrobacter sp.]
MKTFLKPALVAALGLAAVVAPANSAPVAAQTAQRVAVVNIDAVIANSTAYTTATTQRQTTYAAQFQQAETRRAAIQAQLDPLITAFNTARSQPNADQNALQQQLVQIQTMQQNGQNELQQILAPVALSEAYVVEQIQDQLGAALQAAMQAGGVTLVLRPDAVVQSDASHNLNEAVLNQLNRLLPAAQLVPPQGWLPREMREQQAAAAAQAAQQSAEGGR